MSNTAILTDLPKPNNMIAAKVYRLDPPLDGVEYVAASTVTSEQNPLLEILFDAKTHTALFITDGEGSDVDLDRFVGDSSHGIDADVPATFAAIGYTVSTN